MGEDTLTEIKPGILEKIFSVFMSLLTLFCLCMGVFYWVRLIGVFPGNLWRFDLMPWHWQALSSALAVLYPVATCGLWMGLRWGIVLWLTGAIAEIVSMTLYSVYFIWNPWIPLLHVVSLICYSVLSLLVFFSQPRRPQTAVEY